MADADTGSTTRTEAQVGQSLEIELVAGRIVPVEARLPTYSEDAPVLLSISTDSEVALAISAEGAAPVDPVISLQDADGFVLISNDDIDGLVGLDAGFRVIGLAPGDYQVGIRNLAEEEGDVLIRIESQPDSSRLRVAPGAPTQDLAQDSPPNSLSKAIVPSSVFALGVLPPEGITQTSTLPRDSFDRFELRTEHLTEIELVATPQDPDGAAEVALDLVIVVEDSVGNIIGWNDDAPLEEGLSLFSPLFRLEAVGEVVVKVYSFDPEIGGSYTFTAVPTPR